jgi:hypothetical protein
VVQTKQTRRARPGDILDMTGHKVGEPARQGKILEVIGAPASVHYRVRWEDGHETIVYPGSDTRVRPGATPRR